MQNHTARAASSDRLARIAWVALVAFCAPLLGGCLAHKAYIPPAELPKLTEALTYTPSEGVTLRLGTPIGTPCLTTTEEKEECIEGIYEAYIVFKDGSEKACPNPFKATADDGVLSILSYNTIYHFEMSDIEHVDIHAYSKTKSTLVIASVIVGSILGGALIIMSL